VDAIGALSVSVYPHEMSLHASFCSKLLVAESAVERSLPHMYHPNMPDKARLGAKLSIAILAPEVVGPEVYSLQVNIQVALC